MWHYEYLELCGFDSHQDTLQLSELDPHRLKYLSFFAFFSISNAYVIRSYMLVSRL